MPSLDTLIPRFKAADRTTRLETLLDYSRKLPPVPERYLEAKARGEHRVHECQTPVYLWVEVEGGQGSHPRRRAARVAHGPRLHLAAGAGASTASRQPTWPGSPTISSTSSA